MARKARENQVGLATRRDLPRHSEMAEQIGTVRRHLEHEPMIIEVERIDDRRAGREVSVQTHDPRGVATQPQLAFRTEHTLAVLAAQLDPLHHLTVRQGLADAEERIERPLHHHGSARHHLNRLTLTAVDRT